MTPTRLRLAELLAGPRPDVAEANLLIAAEADPGLDIPAALAAVDHYAGLAAHRGAGPRDVAAVLRHAGFLGDRDAYDDPRNSFLHVVLERRKGLPILLSALTIAVADRVGARVAGVGLPGHFVVAVPGDEPVYLDPFDGWRELSRERLGQIVHTLAGIDLAPEHLEPVDVRAMVRRMLLNLRASYLRREDLASALWTVEVEEIAVPDDPDPRMARRSLLSALGRHDEAESSAREDLEAEPDPAVRAVVEQQLAAILEARRRGGG